MFRFCLFCRPIVLFRKVEVLTMVLLASTMTATSRRSFVRSARKSARSSVRSFFQGKAASGSESDSSCSSTTSSLDRNADHPYRETKLCSIRGAKALELLPAYLGDARGVAKYHADEQPEGALSLGVAESKLLEDLLLPRLQQAPSLTADAIYYQPTSGRDDLKYAVLQYMKELVDNDHLKLDNLVVGSGCNAVLENLCFAIADPGDTVLIPTPYYAAFEFDLAARASLRVQGFHCHTAVRHSLTPSQPEFYYPTPDALDAAYERCLKETGRPPKMLLISHPQNPLGICYTESVVRDCITWCRERQVHLVSDEIYAGSVHGDGGFTSALTIAGPDIGPFVHWVYALSKDFAMSGLRIGALYTENEHALLSLQKLNDMCQISSQTQVWTKELLLARAPGDDSMSWTAVFRTENHTRLRRRAKRVTGILDKYQVPYLPPTAGLFVWMDLSRFLPQNDTPDPERALYLSLISDYGLLLTPGQSMRFTRPGFFRCVFTAATDAEFEIALERLESMCQAKKL